MTNDSAQYRQWIIAAAQRYGVPSELALRVAQQESGVQQYWQTGPRAGQLKLSPKGALGIMQVMPANGAGFDLRDPYGNIQAGVRYLAEMYPRFDTWPLAAAAYNAGPARVDEYIAGSKALPLETRQYVAAVTGWGGVPGGMPAQTSPSRALLAAGLLAAGLYVLLS